MKKNGRPADIVEVRVKDWLGSIFERRVAKVTEPEKGGLMIARLKELFALSDEEIKALEKMENARELELQKSRKPQWN